jgi:hypothetical protein
LALCASSVSTTIFSRGLPRHRGLSAAISRAELSYSYRRQHLIQTSTEQSPRGVPTLEHLSVEMKIFKSRADVLGPWISCWTARVP